MNRLYLRLAVLLLVPLTSLTLLAKGLGAPQPVSSDLAGFSEGCDGLPQPCWYGIVPGLTTVDEAVALLESRGYHGEIRVGRIEVTGYPSPPFCHLMIFAPTRVVENLILYFCPRALRTGSVMAAWGLPQEFGFYFYYSNFSGAGMRYPSGVTVLARWMASPLDDVLSITLPAIDARLPHHPDCRWSGFVPPGRLRGFEELHRNTCTWEENLS